MDASLSSAGGAFPPGVAFAWLLARPCGGGDLAGSTFTEGGAELGNFAPDERGRLALAVPLLFAVKAAGPIVAVGIVAKGAEPEDWDKLAIAIVHLGRSAMLPNERRKLELHLVGARCWCRLCAARPFASALATLAFALALGRHQLDKDALLCSLGLEGGVRCAAAAAWLGQHSLRAWCGGAGSCQQVLLQKLRQSQQLAQMTLWGPRAGHLSP